MDVVITESAEDSLYEIYSYHAEYSQNYADTFYDAITDFILQSISLSPHIGHLYNTNKRLYRLIFEARYNIYYHLQNSTVFVLYIVDGQQILNSELLNPNNEQD